MVIRHAELIEDDDRPKSVELRLVFLCSQANVRAALASVMSGLAAMDLTDDDASTVEIVLAEILNNVCEHAYRDTFDGQIEMHLAQTSEGLACRVLDHGEPMPHNRAPSGVPPHPEPVLDMQPEGGFGWFLIRKLTTDLAYARVRGRNVLTFRIEVGQAMRHN